MLAFSSHSVYNGLLLLFKILNTWSFTYMVASLAFLNKFNINFNDLVTCVFFLTFTLDLYSSNNAKIVASGNLT